MNKEDKLASLKQEAEKRGYGLTKNVDLLVNTMFKKEKKLGGLYCPCQNVSIMEEAEKKKYLCPCEGLDNDIKENGVCHCGMFVKKPAPLVEGS